MLIRVFEYHTSVYLLRSNCIVIIIRNHSMAHIFESSFYNIISNKLTEGEGILFSRKYNVCTGDC